MPKPDRFVSTSRAAGFAGAADLDARAAGLLPHAIVLRAEGERPRPVVVQMHGCSGVEPRMQLRYAQAAQAAGVSAVILDSHTPRGLGSGAAALSVCTGLTFRGAERAWDLLATLHWLDAQPWADSARIAAAGWSHGGWAIMEALAGPQASGSLLGEAAVSPLRGLRLALLFYPYCGPLAASTHRRGWGDARPDVLAWLAGCDRVVGRSAPRRALARLSADGLSVGVVEFADATHAFDNEDAVDPRVRHRPDLLAATLDGYAAALRELARDPPPTN